MDAEVADAAMLFADPTRAKVIEALLGGHSASAGELARRAGVSPATASAHLRRLLDADAVSLEAKGRHRYYRLRDARVARAFEALAAMAPPARDRDAPHRRVAADLRFARRCYDHLAGVAGVRIAESLARRKIVVNDHGTYRVSARGSAFFDSIGIDVAALEASRRSFGFPCLDWSEHTHHVAGALGAALLAELRARGWVTPKPASRALQMTAAGLEGLQAFFGVSLEDDARALGLPAR